MLASVFFSPPQLHSSNSQPDSPEKRYQQAKYYFNQLQSQQRLGEERQNWLKGVRSFRKIYLLEPNSDLAPSCLFMLGRMYHIMFKKFGNGIDLNESLSYYHDTSAIFPKSRLADDAHYAMGVIYLEDNHQVQKASTQFTLIVTNYPQGDKYQQARGRLKYLSKEYDIPLPTVMVKDSYHQKLTTVLPVKHWSSKTYTRVVIKASNPVLYRERLLEKMNNKPRRLYIDFASSYIEPKFRSPLKINDGLLQRVRTGQYSPDIVRVVLDIESISKYKIFSLPDPFRVVIDVWGDVKNTEPAKTPTPSKIQDSKPSTSQPVVILYDQKKNLPSNGRTPTADPQVTDQKFSLAQQLGLGVKRIVLDPGHGGKDPGASANGLKEKDIVLKVARKLAPLLTKKLGCEVILTRDSDIYIPLEERTAIANTSDADLFVSLHVNAHPSKKINGLETYFLNLSTNAEAMRVAARENATSTHQMNDLDDILSDIMQNSKINESSRLAKQVHNSLYNGLKPQYKIKSLGVKQAPFYVLIGAQMPAILVEMSFITNRDDAVKLKDDLFLDQVAEQITIGIQRYMNSITAGL